MLTNNYESLESLRSLAGKCPRCSLCKFPPLILVERQAHSAICPSYEEFKFHSSSGGGMLVMAMSLLDGRSRVTEAVRQTVYGCTACGGCDVSCKFSSDIEVQEIILHLRAKVFAELGPYPAHRAILAAIETRGHPLPDAAGTMGSWLAEVDVPKAAAAPYLLWIGPHYASSPARRDTLRHALALLHAAGVGFTVLGGDEPYTGRAALEIGDRALFQRCARRAADAINASTAREVICLSAEDYATLRNQTPRVASLHKPIRHVTELYAQLIQRHQLGPRRAQEVTVAWHDPSYLGRLSEPYQPWSGERKKVSGQILIYDPPRPINYGAQGCYDPPRQVLAAIPGLTVKEFFRRREYAFDSGESGQALAVMPEFAQATAQRRVHEACDVGVDQIVTECPQSVAMLEHACAAIGSAAIGTAASHNRRIAATTLTDLLAERAL